MPRPPAASCQGSSNGVHQRGMRGCGCPKDPDVIAANRKAANLPPKQDSAPKKYPERGAMKTCTEIFECEAGSYDFKAHKRLYGHTRHWCRQKYFATKQGEGRCTRHKCDRPGCLFTW
jgi:hypothetical protein